MPHALWLLALVGLEPPSPLEALAAMYRLEVVAARLAFPVTTTHGKIDGREAPAAALERYVPLLTAEFSLYPPELVKKSRLKRIVLCEGLSFAGQLRSAVPDFEHDTLYLDVSRGERTAGYQAKVLHHEFFHILDLRDDGVLYADDRWAALNPAGFRYGTGGRLAQNVRETGALTERYPGFLTHYATTGVEEDKAEVFAHLIVSAPYLAERLKTDRVVRAKVERMRELLAEFCPDVDEAFWRRIRAVKRP